MESNTFPYLSYAKNHLRAQYPHNTHYIVYDDVHNNYYLTEFLPRLYQVGDKVKTISGGGWGTDDVLTVVSLKTILPEIAPCNAHHRIKAQNARGESWEGAEIYFLRVD